ncbi:MAG: hypothetical protein NTX45_00490, partial [Proteobacteria bacterium]|nr:hypothetical protein [Pseudomonadota bacterium]
IWVLSAVRRLIPAHAAVNHSGRHGLLLDLQGYFWVMEGGWEFFYSLLGGVGLAPALFRLQRGTPGSGALLAPGVQVGGVKPLFSGSAPMSPGWSQRSAASRMRRLSLLENCRRLAVATTSGSGRISPEGAFPSALGRLPKRPPAQLAVVIPSFLPLTFS